MQILVNLSNRGQFVTAFSNLQVVFSKINETFIDLNYKYCLSIDSIIDFKKLVHNLTYNFLNKMSDVFLIYMLLI